MSFKLSYPITVLALALIPVAGAGPALAGSSGCSEYEVRTGTCPTATGSIDGDQATIGANQPGGSGSGGSGSGSGGAATPPNTCATPTCIANRNFTVVTPTLSDLIGFRPAPGVDHMEPNGWTVAGLDTNFYATGGAQVQSGTLLGFPASVRFTPIRWTWYYGDGTSAVRHTRGATWAAQQIHEFDPTPTSHVYKNLGSYVIDLTIAYGVEYTFNGSDWADIVGTISLPANRLTITAGNAKTVLVERDCTLNPHGPGC